MALLDKLIKAEDKGALLFGNEATILGEIKRNQNDAVKYFGDKALLKSQRYSLKPPKKIYGKSI